jgi:hypothetical protein
VSVGGDDDGRTNRAATPGGLFQAFMHGVGSRMPLCLASQE